MNFGVISNLVVIAWLTERVAGSAAIRNKRQWPGSQWTGPNPYGRCGKPTTPIPHGGIKLFPITDFDDPHDNSCYTISSLGCEPKFHCNDGYTKKGDFHLECTRDPETGYYKWEGSIPTCEEIKASGTLFHVNYTVISGVIFALSLMCSAICWAMRQHLATLPARWTGVRSTITRITPSSRAPERRTLGLPSVTGPLGYSRFDDSNVNVPHDETTPTTQDAEVATTEEVSNADSPLSYQEVTTEPAVATTEEVSHNDAPPPYPQEDTVEPASQSMEYNPVAVITNT